VKVLVLNCGSSSIKYQLFDGAGWTPLSSGVLQGIGEAEGRLVHRTRLPDGREDEEVSPGVTVDDRDGLQRVISALASSGWIRDGSDLRVIGHRVVHGGERFREPALLDDAAVAALRGLAHLAPLHNPPAVRGIETARQLCPDVPQVAVFDTAFHATLPPRAYRYAVPAEAYRQGLRRYGFHGTSHRLVAERAAALLGRPLEALRLVTLHLGNGASAAAIEGGRSVDTSMGLTPLEGLVMGTRCGDLDPAAVLHLLRAPGASLEGVERLLHEWSGLQGLCGANDMREILRRREAGDADAGLAVEVYCYRIRKYLGAYHAVIGPLDAVVFTAGVGENSPDVRSACCAGLAHLGIVLDEARNRTRSPLARAVHAPGSAVAVLVVPTHEELAIAQQALAAVVGGAATPPGAPGA
jgi:acetate kinase